MEIIERPTKKDAFTQLIEEGWISLHVDARHPDVAVPLPLRMESRLILAYGHDMPKPITDLVVDDRGVSATLSFNDRPFGTFIPWEAVYVIQVIDGRGICYEEDVPDDVDLSGQMVRRPPPEDRN
jgi:hypothetical protein